MHILDRIAGAAIGIPFVWLGYDAVSEPGQRVATAAAFGVPRPEDAVRLNGAIMLAGGLALATGLGRRPAAVAVAAAMVPTTLAGHSFWLESEPAARKTNRVQFLKNLGLIGGLIAVGVARGE